MVLVATPVQIPLVIYVVRLQKKLEKVIQSRGRDADEPQESLSPSTWEGLCASIE